MAAQNDVEMAEDVGEDSAPLFEAVGEVDDQMEGIVEIQETGVAAVPEASEAVGTASTSAPDGSAERPLTGSYTWKITNWSRLADTKQYSDKFEVATYIWRMLVFPRGNKAEHLSVYLDAPEAAWMPANLNPKASFKLVLVNQLDPTNSYAKDTSHTFSAQETDWGFTQFISLAELNDPAKGYLVDDTLQLRVELTVQRDEKYLYDSRKETGHVGLKNQGATCYMNSLLQYMYHLPAFRKAVYHMPTSEVDEPASSMPLALQTLFYRLQYSNQAVSTKDLTQSFGWSTYDAFMQHDVQELNRVLCERLEEKMKGTRVERVINELFEGHTLNYLQCVNVDYKSQRRESYMDLQLDVKGCKDVYASFDKYTEVEMMVGENQYKAEGHGLQDARKGVLFESFPPVLQLQLKRFEYDFQRDAMVKINDRYEFPDELDLDVGDGKYLAPNADRNVRNLYRLHSVLVHSGGVHGGHYYAFIRPQGDTWYKFDDDRVTIEDGKRALEEQYGGEDEGAPPAPSPLGPLGSQGGMGGMDGRGPAPAVWRFTKYSNAYMLVYVRVEDWSSICCTVTKEDIASHLRDRLEAEQREKERRHREKQEAHLYCQVRLALDKDFRAQVGKDRFFDLVDYERLPPEQSFRVQRHTKFPDFKARVEAELGIPVEHQRYWVWQKRQNATCRPSRRLKPTEEEGTMSDLRDLRDTTQPTSKHALMDLKLYLEVPDTGPDGKVLQVPRSTRTDILLFLKHYDPRSEKLAYVGRIYVPKQAKMQDLFPVLCSLAGLPTTTPLEAYEEIKFEPSVMVERIPNASLLATQAQLEDGDIVCFQAALAGEEQEKGLRHPHVPQFFAYIRNRKLVTFKRLEEPREEGIQLELLRDDDYDTVTQVLADALKLKDPSCLRLTQHNAFSHAPQRNPIKYRGVARLEAMLQHSGHATEVLYYEVLDMPLPELEQLKTLRVRFHDEHTAFVGEHVIRLPRDSSVGDVLEELRGRLAEQYKQRRLRLMEVYNSRIYKLVDPAEDISSINETYWQVRAEAVPQEEEELSTAAATAAAPAAEADEESMADGMEGVGEGAASARLIHCYHIAAERSTDGSDGGTGGTNGGTQHVVHGPSTGSPSIFGNPFLLRIGGDEQLGSIKRRIQAKLCVTDAEFAKWRFAFVSIRGPPEYMEDEDVPAQRFARAASFQTSESAYLGLEHEDKLHGRRQNNATRGYTYEKAIKIN